MRFAISQSMNVNCKTFCPYIVQTLRRGFCHSSQTMLVPNFSQLCFFPNGKNWQEQFCLSSCGKRQAVSSPVLCWLWGENSWVWEIHVACLLRNWNSGTHQETGTLEPTTSFLPQTVVSVTSRVRNTGSSCLTPTGLGRFPQWWIWFFSSPLLSPNGLAATNISSTPNWVFPTV